MLIRSHFKDEITHVCRKCLEVQEFVAYSPTIFTQITTWNLIDSLSAWCVLWSWKYNYSLILFFSFATVISLKSKAGALSDRKIKWTLFLNVYSTVGRTKRLTSLKLPIYLLSNHLNSPFINLNKFNLTYHFFMRRMRFSFTTFAAEKFLFRIINLKKERD